MTDSDLEYRIRRSSEIYKRLFENKDFDIFDDKFKGFIKAASLSLANYDVGRDAYDATLELFEGRLNEIKSEYKNSLLSTLINTEGILNELSKLKIDKYMQESIIIEKKQAIKTRLRETINTGFELLVYDWNIMAKKLKGRKVLSLDLEDKT